MNKYVADFETSTWDENETWVWAWCLCKIDNINEIKINNSIESFIDEVLKLKNPTIYFQNLKFDGEFIIYYLLKNQYKWVKSRKEASDKTFTTLISGNGLFYNLTIYEKIKNKNVKKVEFIDSLKIIPFSVEQISKKFNLPEEKLKLDYDKPREKGYILSEDEENYIKHDVIIVAKALNLMFDLGLTRMTQASNALSNFKKKIGESRFDYLFPILPKDIDEDIRQSYKGGFTYLNPLYKEKDVANGVVLDVNSLYPSVMYYCKLPYGEPKFFSGKYENDKIYPLYVQMITCSFKLKKNKIPSIQIKNSYFKENEYLTSSIFNGIDEEVCLVLTNVDLDLFLEQYEVYNLKFISGWKFKAMNGIFKNYIDYWINIKNKGTIEKNEGMRTIAKLMLNALYGKMGKALKISSKSPYLENDIVHYHLEDDEEVDGIYIPIASFITSYAREKTIRTSQAIQDYSIKKYGKSKYCYSDTDSVHCLLSIEEIQEFCEIDNIELGKWKHEGTFTKARFLRQKCYIEEIEEKLKITCSGMPPRCYPDVTWKNFKIGFVSYNKLAINHVKGRYNFKTDRFYN